MAKRMTVNKSDVTFFELAAEIKSNMMLALTAPPTMTDFRATVKHFKRFLSSEELLPYQEMVMPSSYADHAIRARFIAKSLQKKPLLIFFPGTGFMHDMFDENYSVLSRIMKRIDAHGVMLEYRLSPENPYPAAHEDAVDLLHYLLDNHDMLDIDTSKVIISGYSSGANMAAVLCNSLQNNQYFRPFHQYLLSGAYDYTDSLHDYDDYVNEDKMLDKESQRMSFDLYCQDFDRNDPHCSPYWQADFSNLCPTTIQCGEYDGGRSQSEGYAAKLTEHGVQLTKIIIPGQSHLGIVYRGACSDGEDPAITAAKRIQQILEEAQ